MHAWDTLISLFTFKLIIIIIIIVFMIIVIIIMIIFMTMMFSGNSSECRLEVSAATLADHGTWTCSLSQDKVGS